MSGETEVDIGSGAEMRLLLVEVRYVPNRVGMSVLDDRRYPSCRSCSGPVYEVLARGVTGIHQMNVGVNHPGEDDQAADIHDLAFRIHIADSGYALILDLQVAENDSGIGRQRGSSECGCRDFRPRSSGSQHIRSRMHPPGLGLSRGG